MEREQDSIIMDAASVVTWKLLRTWRAVRKIRWLCARLHRHADG